MDDLVLEEFDNILSFSKELDNSIANNISNIVYSSIISAQKKEPVYSFEQLDKLKSLNSPESVMKLFSNRYSLVSKFKGNICGVGSLKEYSEGNSSDYELMMVYVDSDFKGLGLGKKIIEGLEKKVISLDGARLFAESALFPSTRAFYESRGFRLHKKIKKQFEDRIILAPLYVKEFR